MGEVSREFLLRRQEKLVEKAHALLENMIEEGTEQAKDRFLTEGKAIVDDFNVNKAAIVATYKKGERHNAEEDRESKEEGRGAGFQHENTRNLSSEDQDSSSH